MAEETEKTVEQEQPNKGETKEKSESSNPVFLWAIMGIMVFATLVGGFALAQLLGGPSPDPLLDQQQDQQQDQSPAQPRTFNEMVAQTNAGKKLWYYPLDPVVVNLDVPGVTRYLRASITIELSPDIDSEQGTVFLGEKALILRDQLRTYFADLGLEQVRGRRNLDRIKKQIREIFNELLFPDGKPYITGIFLKEFAVQ